MRHAVIRGTILSGMGILILLACGAFLPLEKLKIWGFPIFLISMTLITWGLLPYRRLRRLEMSPYRLTLDDKKWLHFAKGTSQQFGIPLCSLERIDYIEKKHDYGIGITLKEPLPKKLVVYINHFSLMDFRRKSLKRYGCDLFLPYFSNRSYQELLEITRFDHNPD